MSNVATGPLGAPAKIFRAMRKDEEGKPRCGTEANMLGVRPGFDITPDETGRVVGGQGGLSVTPNDPKLLPPHVRPKRFGGKGKLPVFELPTSSIGESLSYRPDPEHPDRHGFIEPGHPMLLNDYQSALAATRDSWKEVA